MDYVITIVASHTPLSAGHIAEAENFLQLQGLGMSGQPAWLAKHKAADIPFSEKPDLQTIKGLRATLSDDGIDVFVTPSEGRRKKLLIADMDSTIVNGETLDELAAEAGIKDQIAPITERAMRGELDFEQALRERVKLLKGLPDSCLQDTLQKTELNPGAKIFVQSMKNFTAACVLVSGGFTLFTEAFGMQAGFDAHHGNMLQIENGVLTGEVIDPILDKSSKVDFLLHYTQELGLDLAETIAIGDGANDLPMLQKAGLGIGYKPKPLIEDVLDNCIIHGDLTAALYAQGYIESELFSGE